MSDMTDSLPMHICPECDTDKVYPVEWSETHDLKWEIVLRCPNCEWCERGVFEHEAVEEFDHVLNVGTDALIDDLEVLQKANFAEYAARFVKALRGDHLLPEDF